MNEAEPIPFNPEKRYLKPLITAGAISWAGFTVVLTKLDPYESTGLALALFFLSLLIALTCTFTVTGFYLRKWITSNEVGISYVNTSIRQGLLLSLCTLICLAFLLLGVLTWWNGLLVVTVIVLLEFYVTSRNY
ncbi:MAG: hypothetical protein ACD_51C00259G0020 [uncultured bacterium]|nr:MAG: hypothetical protein ACD_51C00259G0020 [uncultured bacterium]OGJ47255.1 MAG: hypothetical protein A2244_00210 [Candidatus Peregrinibacteria bacterium RIFOXYA2_FULL_41_18]OGJ48441.1 MAG: hypothetical protein A2344_05585 [Candidatus Peregrinibacteria bacterium RIFOXYB12_FULL_41_12]HBY01682.1 hypothetical protein [Rikenellaceae bacterium]